ncbi:hypothetical protein ACFL0W_00620 [Nanoarchaeota archaeon]
MPKKNPTKRKKKAAKKKIAKLKKIIKKRISKKEKIRQKKLKKKFIIWLVVVKGIILIAVLILFYLFVRKLMGLL